MHAACLQASSVCGGVLSYSMLCLHAYIQPELACCVECLWHHHLSSVIWLSPSLCQGLAVCSAKAITMPLSSVDPVAPAHTSHMQTCSMHHMLPDEPTLVLSRCVCAWQSARNGRPLLTLPYTHLGLLAWPRNFAYRLIHA